MSQLTQHRRPKTCLTIAGSDCSGGAGIQADLKTFEAFGVYGASVITLITAQNTVGVQAVEHLAVDLIRAQLHSVFSDIKIDAIKIGALLSASVINVVYEAIREQAHTPLIVDPVMISKHGDRLFDKEAQELLTEMLLERAAIITPNRSEAAALLGHTRPLSETQARLDAIELAKRLNTDVLVTGGNTQDEMEIVDWLVSGGEAHRLGHARVHGRHQHGAGCTLSSAITAKIAHGHTPYDATVDARAYVREAMLAAPLIGHGHGPLWHQVRSENHRS